VPPTCPVCDAEVPAPTDPRESLQSTVDCPGCGRPLMRYVELEGARLLGDGRSPGPLMAPRPPGRRRRLVAKIADSEGSSKRGGENSGGCGQGEQDTRRRVGGRRDLDRLLRPAAHRQDHDCHQQDHGDQDGETGAAQDRACDGGDDGDRDDHRQPDRFEDPASFHLRHLPGRSLILRSPRRRRGRGRRRSPGGGSGRR
jgi:hypothetical protein